MEIYKIPIEFAIIVFPFVAFILTIPFLIYQYRKYGAIPVLKSIIFYSFILYLITAYFMVILPLPSMKYVSQLKTPYTQLQPFRFIFDISQTIPKTINNISELLTVLNISTIYTVLFNFLLTLPFGVYLRYYFNKKWYQSLLCSFFLSLFFELTQLSGLYGIYPRPYRLFDVDDLIINTLGGLFGHIITPLFMMFLPTRQELEDKSYKKGTKVSIIRRLVAVLIDIIFLAIISIMVKILTYGTEIFKLSSIITILIYYTIVPLIGNGKTIGKKLMKINITGINEDALWHQILFRYLILSLFILYPYVIIDIMTIYGINSKVIMIVETIIYMFIFINIIYFVFYPRNKERLFLYERITNTKNISTIEYEQKEEPKKENAKIKLNI